MKNYKKIKLGKNMMKTRTPTQIKKLKNTNLNTEFSFLTCDCLKSQSQIHRNLPQNHQLSTTNPKQLTHPLPTQTHRSKLPHPNLIKKKRNSASLSAIPFRSENETHHQTPICERIPPPNSDLCHHRNPPPNFNLSH